MVMNEEGEDWLTDCEQVFVPEAASNLEYTYKQVKLSEEATCRLRKAVQKKKEKERKKRDGIWKKGSWTQFFWVLS